MNAQTVISQDQYGGCDGDPISTYDTNDPLNDTAEATVNHPAAMHEAINSTIKSQKGY